MSAFGIRSFLIPAIISLGASQFLASPSFGVEQLTADSLNADWSRISSSTSRGKVLWTDGNDVFYFNGTTATTIQVRDNNVDSLSGGVEVGSMFSLGSSDTPGEVMGAWRRGSNGDYAWLFESPSTLTEVVDPVNPFSAGVRHNPEGVGIADGSIFMLLQAFSNANGVKMLFEVNPADGTATHLSGTDPVQGVTFVATSGGQAAWVYNPNDFDNGTAEVPTQLFFFDGNSATQVDSGELAVRVSLNRGQLVYTKLVSGISQVFLYDSTAAVPAPVQLTTDATGDNGFAQTDGRHIVWLHGEANGTNRHAMLNGGLQLTDAINQPEDLGVEVGIQLQRGQLMWRDKSGALRYDDGTATTYDGYATVREVDIAPATSIIRPWLADGYVAWFGLSNDAGIDNEVFLFTGTPPADAEQPSPPLLVLATPADAGATLNWDDVLGADSYNVYYAPDPSINKNNFDSLKEGRMLQGVTSPLPVTDLANNRVYYFVVTCIENGIEGPISRKASVTPGIDSFAATNISGVNMHAVTANTTDGEIAFASGSTNVYKSEDGGATWSGPLTGTIAGRDVRALASRGLRAFGATKDGDLLRSIDGGTGWSVVADGSDLGELNKSLAIDPSSPDTIYAGDFQLSSYNGLTDSYVIKATDGGAVWAHTPVTALSEIRAYSLVVDPSGTVYAGGTSSPNVAKSTDGGANWAGAGTPDLTHVYALALNPIDANIVFAGGVGFVLPAENGVSKSTDGGATWVKKNAGFPPALGFVRSLVFDDDNPNVVFVGTDDGMFYTPDGGEHWVERNAGLAKAAPTIYGLAFTPNRQLLAAASTGLFILDLSVVDRAPVVTDPGDQSNVEGDAVSLQINANDPDDDTLTYSAQNLPPGLNIGPSTGLIDGTVLAAKAGDYSVTVTATAGTLSGDAAFTWHVSAPPVNHTPVVTDPGDQANTEGDVISLQIQATDEDNDSLTYTAQNLPPGLDIGASTGLIEGTILAAKAGDYSVTVFASDGQVSGQAAFNWHVNPLVVNHAPVVTNPGEQFNVEGDVVGLQIQASDEDNDALTYSAQNLPPGLSINVDTGLIDGTVLASKAGDFAVTVSVSDGQLGDDASFTWHISVSTGNHTPLVTNPGAQSNVEGDVVSLQIQASDLDGDTLTYTAQDLPPGLSISATNGLISGTILFAKAGDYAVEVSASDGELTGHAIFAWHVAAPPVDGTPGDVDGNNDVNAVDIQLVINAALDLSVGQVNPDVNCDNAIDAVDVQLVINAALDIPIPQCGR
jgi:hypothetical protein